MEKLEIHTGKDLKACTLHFLTEKFGKSGLHYYNIVRGIHLSPVQPHRSRKSISSENTFPSDLNTKTEMEEHLYSIFEELVRRIEKSGINGRTVTLKIKFSDFNQQTRSKTLEQFPDPATIWKTAKELLSQDEVTKPVRLLGLGLSNLNTQEVLTLPGDQYRIPFDANFQADLKARKFDLL